jgi:hypothetical protein
MRTPLLLKLLPGLLLTLLLAGVALAGGVIVTLDTAVPETHAGDPFTVEFTIRSMHDGSLQEGFSPFVTATHGATGEVLTFNAKPLADPGRYAVTLALPAAGEWAWQIHPEAYYPQELIAVMPPIQALPAAGSVPPAAGDPAVTPPVIAPGLLWTGAAALGLLALITLGLLARRKAPAPAQS